MTQDEMIEYRCEECGKSFKDAVEWEQHNRKIHSRYTCEHCRDNFDAVDEFESHNFKMHPDQQKIQR